jgi:hypothetical protein
MIKKSPGRKPLDPSSSVPSADVHLTLPANEYDRIHRVASQQGKTVPCVIRDLLRNLK